MVNNSELGFVINPGKMRYPVTIINRAYTRSLSGELVSDGDPTTISLMAAREYNSGGEKVSAEIDASSQALTYVTRYDARITTSSRLKDDSTTVLYDIESIRIIGPLRYMVITVKEIRHGQ